MPALQLPRLSQRFARLVLCLAILSALLVPLGVTAQTPVDEAPTWSAAPRLTGPFYQACLYAGSLSQVSETLEPLNPSLVCGRGTVIVLQGGSNLHACLYAGTLSRVGTSQPTCSRGVMIGLSTAVSDYHACLYSGSLSQVSTTPPVSCGRGMPVGLQGVFNQPPVTTADNYTTDEDTTLTVIAPGVLGNDTDPEGDAMTAQLGTSTVHGTLFLNPDGSFTYTPTADYHGPDSFTYRAVDEYGATSALTTVSITVNPINDAPVAVGDSYTTNEDIALNVAAPGVLTNDTDVDGDALSAVQVAGPAHGTLTLDSNGSFTYNPVGNYHGPDSFTYKANDGTADSSVVTVNITVTPVNDVPVANNDSHTIAEDTELIVTAPGVLGNDTDIDGDTLFAILVDDVSNGTLILNANGSFSYTPDDDFNGPDSFTYRANDGSASSPEATVTLTVEAVNDAPVAVNDSFTTAEDPASPVAGNVLSNDTDTENHTLTAALVTGPSNASSFTLNADGSFTYTPEANFHGPDSFTYQANDGQAANNLSNVATVTITVTPVNDVPVAVDDAYDTAGAATLNVSAALGVLANDTDVEGATLTAVLVQGPTNGTLDLDEDGSFTYTANPGATSDSFTYQANDGSADSNVATVSITINALPVAANKDVTTNEDTAVTVTLSATDADGDDIVSFDIASGPGTGTLGAIGAIACDAITPRTCTADVQYTPGADENEGDSFTYTASDASGTSLPATVTITITPLNDAPVLANIETEALAYTEGGPATVITASITVTDVDSTTLTGATVTVSSGFVSGEDVLGFVNTTEITGSYIAGVLTLTGTATLAQYQAALRSVTYDNLSENPGTTKTITFRVDDGGAVDNLSNQVSRDIAITAINDAPVVTAPTSDTVLEDTDLTFSTANTNLISVADVDAGSNAIQVTLTAQNGIVTLSGTAGLTFSDGDGTADASMTFTGTLADANTALDGMIWRGTEHFNSTRGTASLTIVVNDQGHTGGGALQDTETVAITITAVNDAPVIADKEYDAQTNMRLQISGATQGGNLLSGATDPDDGDNSGGFTATLTASLVAGTISPNTAAVTVDANGDFTFDGPPGYSGDVTFDYQVCDNGNPIPAECSTATVTVTVAGTAIWFVNPSAGTNGNGTLNSPFNTLASADAINTAGDRFFLYTGTAANSMALANQQWLIGQGVTGASFDAVFSITPPDGTIARPSIGGTRPTVSPAAGTAVTLGNSNTVRGLNVSAPSGITGADVDTLIINELDLTSTAGVALSLTGGTSMVVSIESLSATNTAGRGVLLQSSTGTTTLGSVVITNTGGTGFEANSAGTLVINGTVNTINTTTGTALNVTGTTLGAGATFRSIAASGGANGIVLVNTGTAFGLTVTGTGTAGSGGTIQNTGAGASFTNARHISLSWMNFTNANTLDGGLAGACDGTTVTNCQGAVKLITVQNVTLDRLTINGAEENGIFGNNVTKLTVSNSTIQNAGNGVWEHGIRVEGLFGTAADGNANAITATSVSASGNHNVWIQNTTATSASASSPDRLVISGSTFSNPGTTSPLTPSDGVSAFMSGTANFQTVVQNSTFTHDAAATGRSGIDGFQGDASGTSRHDVSVSGSTFDGFNTSINVSGANTGTVTFNVSNNPTISSRQGQGINLASNGSSTLRGTISNNTNVTNGIFNGNAFLGIWAVVDATGHIVAIVNGNTISGFATGIAGSARNAGTGQLDMTITNNTITAGGQFPYAGAAFDAGNNSASESNRVCLNLSNNNISGPGGAADYVLSQYSSNVFQLQGFAGTGTNPASVEAFVSSTDIGGATVIADGGPIVNYTAGTCATP